MTTSGNPGVVFYIEKAEVNKTRGVVELSAKVSDVDLWEDVIAHFDGMKLYRGKDFKSEIIALLQRKTGELEGEVDRVYERARQEAARTGQELEFLREKVKTQQRELRELRSIVGAFEGAVS